MWIRNSILAQITPKTGKFKRKFYLGFGIRPAEDLLPSIPVFADLGSRPLDLGFKMGKIQDPDPPLTFWIIFPGA
jgi:hypothetical protein